MKTYEGHGVRFQYPSDWEVTEESRDGDPTITASHGGAFWSLTVLRRRPAVQRVLKQACEAFQEIYGDVDIEEESARIGEEAAEGMSLEFVSLELVNFVLMAACRSGAQTLFVLSQATDHERGDYEPEFAAISASVRRIDDEEVEIS